MIAKVIGSILSVAEYPKRIARALQSLSTGGRGPSGFPGPQGNPGLLGLFLLLLIVVALGLGGLCAASGAGPAPQPQPPEAPVINLTLRVGESVTRNIWCRNPVNDSASMTVAAAGTLTNSAPNIASAAIVDPNGNSGQGGPITQGLVESPAVKITGLNPSPPRARITVLISCPELFNPARGIGMVPHAWIKARINVTVVAPPPVPNGGGGQPGMPGGGPGQPGSGGGGNEGGGSDSTVPAGPDTPTEHGGTGHEPAPAVPVEIVPLDLHGCLEGPCGPADGACSGEDCADATSPCEGSACSPEQDCDGCDDAPPCEGDGCGSECAHCLPTTATPPADGCSLCHPTVVEDSGSQMDQHGGPANPS